MTDGAEFATILSSNLHRWVLCSLTILHPYIVYNRRLPDRMSQPCVVAGHLCKEIFSAQVFGIRTLRRKASLKRRDECKPMKFFPFIDASSLRTRASKTATAGVVRVAGHCDDMFNFTRSSVSHDDLDAPAQHDPGNTASPTTLLVTKEFSQLLEPPPHPQRQMGNELFAIQTEPEEGTASTTPPSNPDRCNQGPLNSSRHSNHPPGRTPP